VGVEGCAGKSSGVRAKFQEFSFCYAFTYPQQLANRAADVTRPEFTVFLPDLLIVN
jgi:hypothetical protein